MRLGLFAYEAGDHKRATEWYELVLDRLNKRKAEENNSDQSSITYAMVYDHLSYALGRVRYSAIL